MATILIKPVVDPEKDSIGLSKLGLNSYPGTGKISQVPLKHGRFLTGYDVNAFYISSLPEKERKKEIDRINSECERMNALYPHYNICDCSITNPFYSEMLIEIKPDLTFFDTNNIIDAVKLSIIETNAKYNMSSIIAISYQEVLESNRDYKYYIANEERDVEAQVSKRREINKAISTLDNLEANDKTKLLLVTKYLFRPNKSYNTESTMKIYKKCDDYIHGTIDGEKTKASDETYKNFVKVAGMSNEELIAKVLVKYAIYLNIIRLSKEKQYIFLKTGQELGNKPEDIYNYIISPKNRDTYDELLAEVEKEIKIY